MVASAWSAAGAPPSWRLTAAQFGTLRDDAELLSIAAAVPAEKLPPLLFTAAATFLILELRPEPLRSWFPKAGEPQPAVDAAFPAEYREFCLDNRHQLLELCSEHRYQMNEVGRCADVIPALTPVASDGRDVVLVDVGTGAGLGLHLDRYHYVYRGPGGRSSSAGDPGSSVRIEVEVRGEQPPALPATLPAIVDRVGIDTEPLDLSEPAVRRWLAACVPQEITAVTRFQRATEIATSAPGPDGPGRRMRPAARDSPGVRPGRAGLHSRQLRGRLLSARCAEKFPGAGAGGRSGAGPGLDLGRSARAHGQARHPQRARAACATRTRRAESARRRLRRRRAPQLPQWALPGRAAGARPPRRRMAGVGAGPGQLARPARGH